MLGVAGQVDELAGVTKQDRGLEVKQPRGVELMNPLQLIKQILTKPNHPVQMRGLATKVQSLFAEIRDVQSQVRRRPLLKQAQFLFQNPIAQGVLRGLCLFGAHQIHALIKQDRPCQNHVDPLGFNTVDPQKLGRGHVAHLFNELGEIVAAKFFPLPAFENLGQRLDRAARAQDAVNLRPVLGQNRARERAPDKLPEMLKTG